MLLALLRLQGFLKEEEGQDLVEYALLLVFLALAAIVVLPVLGNAVNNVFSQSASTLTTASSLISSTLTITWPLQKSPRQRVHGHHSLRQHWIVCTWLFHDVAISLHRYKFTQCRNDQGRADQRR